MNKNLYYHGFVYHRFNSSKNRSYSVFNVNDEYLELELTNGVYTIIDFDDFENIVNYYWRSQYDNSINSYYVLGQVNDETISLHRYIANVSDISITVDHKDRNPLNNRKDNLRLATHLQQCLNQTSKKSKLSSTYNGVSKRNDVSTPTYRVRAQDINGKQCNIGSFKDEIIAAQAWDDFMYEQYKEHNPLEHIKNCNISGEPTINFIQFNFPERLSINEKEDNS